MQYRTATCYALHDFIFSNLTLSEKIAEPTEDQPKRGLSLKIHSKSKEGRKQLQHNKSIMLK